MTKPWEVRSGQIHERFLVASRAAGRLSSESEVLHFLALAVCGEAGELANLVKKAWRGDGVDPALIRDELADIRIYLGHLARHLEIDLDDACERKLDLVERRLGLDG